MRKALLKCTLNGIHGKLMPVSERQVVTDGSAESASAVAYGATPHSRNYRQNALYNTAGGPLGSACICGLQTTPPEHQYPACYIEFATPRRFSGASLATSPQGNGHLLAAATFVRSLDIVCGSAAARSHGTVRLNTLSQAWRYLAAGGTFFSLRHSTMALGSQQGPTTYCETQADRDDAKGTSQSHDDFDSLLEPLHFSRQSKVSGEAEYACAKGDSKERPFVARIGEQLFSLAQLVQSIGVRAERQANEGSSESQSAPDPQTAHPLKYLPLAAGVLTCIWGWRVARSIERVVALRYSDIAYQIRRPDALTSRISAFKFLVLGGLVLPSSAVAFASWQSRMKPVEPAGLSKASEDMHTTSQELPSPRRLLLGDMLPVATQAELRRLAQSFHRGFSEFVEAVAPSKEKWAKWAAGARASHTTGLHNPSAWTSRIPTFTLPDSKAAD